MAEKLLKSDRATLVFEALGEGKIRITSSSWEDGRTIADSVLEVRAVGKVLYFQQKPRTDDPVDGDAYAAVQRARTANVTRNAEALSQRLRRLQVRYASPHLSDQRV